MQKAIAGGGRLCQAAVLSLFLPISLAMLRAASPAQSPAATTAAQAVVRVERDGVTIEEPCQPDAHANPYAPCGTLARQAADVVGHLTPILGPFPGKAISIGVWSVPPRRRVTLPTGARILILPGVARAFDHPEFFPAEMPFEVARQWLLPPELDLPNFNAGYVQMFAEYLAWRYLLETNPEAARVKVAQAMRDSVAQRHTQPVSALFEPLVNPLDLPHFSLDQRAVLVMRTLETVIDRERVDRALAEFVPQHRTRPFALADFQRVCEKIAGRKLGWFFEYFYEGTGIPTIELRSLPSELASVAAGEIVVRGLPPEGSVRVEMAIRTAQGVIEHSVATRGEITPFSVNVPAPALGITLDPDLRIMRWTEAA